MRYILFLLILLCSSFSFAQENDESVDSDNIEVVTSAFRKETALQDTGLAVTVITATDIESKNLKEFMTFSSVCLSSIPKNELFRNWCSN